jgi:putative transposase
MVAEFEADLIQLRTKEGMKVAKAKGRMRSRPAQAQSAPGGASSRCTALASTARPNSATSSA